MATSIKPRAERTRKAILVAASKHFLHAGFAGTSMDDIAALAGVSKQTVYAHFQSKEALFLEMVRGMTDDAGDAVFERVADPATDRPIEDFLTDYSRQQLAIVMTPALMRLRRLVIAEVERFPELGKALHERGPGRSISRLAATFAAYAQAGQIAVGDPRQAASFFNWLLMGAPVNDAMLLGDGAIPPQGSLERHVREAVRIFLTAHAPGKA